MARLGHSRIMAYQLISDQLEHLVKVYGSFGTSHGLKRSARSPAMLVQRVVSWYKTSHAQCSC